MAFNTASVLRPFQAENILQWYYISRSNTYWTFLYNFTLREKILILLLGQCYNGTNPYANVAKIHVYIWAMWSGWFPLPRLRRVELLNWLGYITIQFKGKFRKKRKKRKNEVEDYIRYYPSMGINVHSTALFYYDSTYQGCCSILVDLNAYFISHFTMCLYLVAERIEQNPVF